MQPELYSLCRQFVTIEPRASVDAYGTPTYGAAQTYRCRVSGQRQLLINERGEEVYALYTVHLVDRPTISPHDRLTLSTGDVGSTETGARQRPILRVGAYTDEMNRRHTSVFLA